VNPEPPVPDLRATRGVLRRELAGSLVLFLIAAAYYAGTTAIPSTSLEDEFGPRGLPSLLALLLALIAGALAVRALLAARGAAAAADDQSEAPPLRAFGLLLLGALYIPAAWLLGYIPALFLLMLAVMLYEGARLSWRTAVIAAGGAAGFWLLFVQVLGATQPGGLLFM
jgi:putative tricarboxylic transport membrane protein